MFPVRNNSFYPTLESMFTVYLGVHNTTNIRQGNIAPGVRMSVKTIIKVCFVMKFILK